MIPIDNTQIAFILKTENDLKKMCFLFKIISKVLIVSFSKSLTKIVLFIHFPLNWRIKQTVFKHIYEGENKNFCMFKV